MAQLVPEVHSESDDEYSDSDTICDGRLICSNEVTIDGVECTSMSRKKKPRKKRNKAKKKLDLPATTYAKTCTITYGNAEEGIKTIVINRDISRNVAKAAGVDWGEEEATPRMIELQRRHDNIVDIAEAGKLTLLNIKEHNEFLAQLTRQIADEGEQMKRKFRIANAKQCRSSDQKRAAAHQAQAAAIQRRQKRYNNEVAMAQCEVG